MVLLVPILEVQVALILEVEALTVEVLEVLIQEVQAAQILEVEALTAEVPTQVFLQFIVVSQEARIAAIQVAPLILLFIK